MIYFKDETLIHENAFSFYKRIERQLFNQDPFGLMRHLVENDKERQL